MLYKVKGGIIAPAAVSGKRWVIGDIHGCRKTFEALVDALNLTACDRLILLGDYIDRGPDSSGVLEMIFKLIKSGYQITALAGNHEAMMLYANKHFPDFVFEDYAVNQYRCADLLEHGRLKQAYRHFMKHLPYACLYQDFILVHAGLNFQAEDPFEDYDSMLEIRNFPVDANWLNGRRIIHGHHPTRLATIEAAVEERRSVVPLDAGCVFAFKRQVVSSQGLGYLCALDLDNWVLKAIPCQD